MSLSEAVEELRDLGVRGSAYRIAHEIRMRSGLASLSRGVCGTQDALIEPRSPPFALPSVVSGVVGARIAQSSVDHLVETAAAACQGRILAFGRWTADFGVPMDWHIHPVSRQRWNPQRHWSRALDDAAFVGDVKLTWEAARFPQAYHLARAAILRTERRSEFYAALHSQILSFLDANTYPLGVHWASGQEGVIRGIAWLFALRAFRALGEDVSTTLVLVGRHLATLGRHLEAELGYARRAVYNNHLIAESLGLYLVGWSRPDLSDAHRWHAVGVQLLTEQADRQVYRDGAYINQSHNYHRVILQDYLFAYLLRRAEGEPVPAPWTAAMSRSLDFLVAHQNPEDGRLPNYGSNDGSLPRVLSTCDFADMRPTLQAISIAVRGERLYPPGPWDEESAWYFGNAIDSLPLRMPRRATVSFPDTGYHVLRGDDPSSFATFRCGSLRDRFSQIDMLHVDIWWRGINIMVDAGSYLYNGPAAWHDYFFRTASHNTVTVDAHDQMLHRRRFKVLHRTKAATLIHSTSRHSTVIAGEHDGFRRFRGACVHRRSVLMAGDDLWVVVDRISGEGTHDVRLHWLAGPFAHAIDPATSMLTLTTPQGTFSVRTFDGAANALAPDIAVGQENPPRGWFSRHYADKVQTPSLAVHRCGPLPLTLISVLAPGVPEVTLVDGVWSVRGTSAHLRFVLREGIIAPLDC